MEPDRVLTPAAIEEYLRSRPAWIRWREWLRGRRYLATRFESRPSPLVIVAHSFRDAAYARQTALAVEQDWAAVPAQCREAYEEILAKAPGLVVLQLRRKNICGCLGHRHVVVREAPFTESHDVFCGATVGEMDIAYERVLTWQALPLTDTALDTKFVEGARQNEFRAEQFRLRMLSILLHEINHLVFPRESEASIRARSLAFYRDALASYAEGAVDTLSFTIDRSFSRFG